MWTLKSQTVARLSRCSTPLYTKILGCYNVKPLTIIHRCNFLEYIKLKIIQIYTYIIIYKPTEIYYYDRVELVYI